MKAQSLIKFSLLTSLLAGSGSTAPASAQQVDAGRPLQIEDYFALKSVSDPRISPDGEWVAYTVRSQDLEKDRAETRLWMVSTSGGEAIPMTATGSSISRPRWSPDGRYLAFLSQRAWQQESEGEGTQVFRLDVRGGEGVQVTNVKPGVEAYEWSPDGKQLVLVVRDADSTQGDGPWVIDRLQFKEDYEGYLNRLRAHLYVFDIETKASVQITSGDYEDSEPAWSPDGSTIAFVSNRTDEPDSNYDSDIWLVRADVADTAQDPVRVTSNEGTDDSPIWHPDGDRLAYLTTTRPELPWYYLPTQLAVIRIGEDDPVILTASLDRKLYQPRFSADGNSVYAMLEDWGQVHLAEVSIEDGSLSRPIAGRRRVEASVVGPDGSVVALVSGPQLPGELFILDANARGSSDLRRLTHVNDELLSTVALADAEEVRYPTSDGTIIQSFIYKPQDFDPTRRYPTLLWLHGGQESQYDFGWEYRVQLFAANGYVVVMPNVRGSGGRGLDFTLANWQAWGTNDAEDVLVTTDSVLGLGYVDPDRLGIGGWSYGCMLTSYVITVSERFAGAVCGAGNALWVANYGHDRYQDWYENELGLPWETRELWEAASPFNKVQNITTPTLWIGGEKDWNVPIQNSEQMYQAMRRLGRETLLVVYPDAHHGIRRPTYQNDRLERFVGWFDQYVKER